MPEEHAAPIRLSQVLEEEWKQIVSVEPTPPIDSSTTA